MKTLLALAIAGITATAGTAFAEDTPYYQRLAYENLYNNVDDTASKATQSDTFSFATTSPFAPVSGERFESIIKNPNGGGDLRQVHVRAADGSLKLIRSTNIDSK